MLIFFLLLLLFFHLNSCIEQSYLIVHQKESLRTFTLYLTQTLIQLKPFLHDSEILVLSEYQKFNHSIVETIFGEDIKNFKLIFESFDYGYSEVSIGQKFNYIASYAKGKIFVFLNVNSVLNSASALPKLIYKLKEPGVGVVGCKVLDANDNIHSSGYEIIASQPIQSTSRSFMSLFEEDEQEERNIDVIARFREFNGNYKLANREANVSGVAEEDYFRAGKFKENYVSQKYAEIDLCLTLAVIHSLRTIYDPRVLVTTYIQNNEKITQEEKDYVNLNRIWSAREKQFLITQYHEIKNVTLLWSMDCGSGQVLGFTMESINFVMALHKRINLVVYVLNVRECIETMDIIGLPMYIKETMKHLISDRARDDIPPENVQILVLHKDPGRYEYSKNMAYNDREPDYSIGRSMYETDRIPTDWIDICNSNIVDEIWTPSNFNVETFAHAGVDRTKLFQIPELVDVFHFDRQLYEDEAAIPQVAYQAYQSYSPTGHQSSSSSGHEALSTQPHPDTEKRKQPKISFLSILKWEKRKAWNEILTAYYHEFALLDHDKVKLVILSKMSKSDLKEYEEFKSNYLKKNSFITDSNLLPEIQFISKKISYLKLPRLYMSRVALIGTSHGEGWGLPLTEAMCMGVITIATNWSGNLEFMNDNNSLLVSVEKLVDANTEGHKWALPSIQSLRSHLRLVYNSYSNTNYESKYESNLTQIAKNSQHVISHNYSLQAVGDIVIQNILRILMKKNLPVSYSKYYYDYWHDSEMVTHSLEKEFLTDGWKEFQNRRDITLREEKNSFSLFSIGNFLFLIFLFVLIGICARFTRKALFRIKEDYHHMQ